MNAAVLHSPAVATSSAAEALPIEAVGLGKVIDGRAVLADVNLRIGAGEYVAVIGANGAGKSTLLKILATLTPASSGQLVLFGAESGRELVGVRSRIGLVGHQSMLYRDLSARENLVFFGKLYGIENPAARADRLLEVIGLLGRADEPVKNFSRGMTQRVAIARALMHDPDLLLADEPFDGLDAPSVESTGQLLAHLHRAGKTIVLVNHDIGQSLRLAPRVIVLRRGRVVMDRRSESFDVAGVLGEVSGS